MTDSVSIPTAALYQRSEAMGFARVAVVDTVTPAVRIEDYRHQGDVIELTRSECYTFIGVRDVLAELCPDVPLPVIERACAHQKIEALRADGRL